MTMLPDVTPIAEKTYNSFRAKEPAVLTGLITGPVAGVLGGLATSGVISPASASNLTATLVGVAVFAVMSGQGFLVRRFVQPAWKRWSGEDLVVDEDEDLGEVTFDSPVRKFRLEPVQRHPLPGPGKPDEPEPEASDVPEPETPSLDPQPDAPQG